VGPNGAGKSTLLALAAGLLAPSSGRVMVGGSQVRPATAPAATGYLPQRSAFASALRVREILDFTLAARAAGPAARDEMLAATGLEAVLGRAAGTLSGGWLRRLGLACALVPPAALLLLDEPFVGLDPGTLDHLIEHLQQRAAEGATVVVSSHDFSVIDQLAARVAVLDEGVLAAAPSAVTHSRALYRAVLSARADPVPQTAALDAHHPQGKPSNRGAHPR